MKLSGALSSLLQGVSQQIPHRRAEGQHTVVDNMIPDPVNGLSRRHGSVLLAQQELPGLDGELPYYQNDIKGYKSYDFSMNGKDYVLLYRSTPRTTTSTYEFPLFVVFDKTNNVFCDVEDINSQAYTALDAGGVSSVTSIGKFLYIAGNDVKAEATSDDIHGASYNEGKAAVWFRGSAYSKVYTIKLTLTDNSTHTFTYTTPSASYPKILDTSAIPAMIADPNVTLWPDGYLGKTQAEIDAHNASSRQSTTEGCQIVLQSITVDFSPTLEGGKISLTKGAFSPDVTSLKIGRFITDSFFSRSYHLADVLTDPDPNQRRYYYDSNTNTVWVHNRYVGRLDAIITYSHDAVITNPIYTQTSMDATNAYNQAVTAWMTSSVEAIQPHAVAATFKAKIEAAGISCEQKDGTLLFTNVKSIDANDGGSGDLIKAVAQEIKSVNDVTDVHFVGKVIKIRETSNVDAYYLRAEAQTTGKVEGDIDTVTWVEGAGQEIRVTQALCLGAYVDMSNTFYFGYDFDALESAVGYTIPRFTKSKVGDADTSPMPYFVGKTITYLGVFQDRLLIGAGSVLRASQVGDYMNLFRKSVLSYPADDALEILSQGTDDDILRYSVMYDRDLVLFGDKRQYAISGAVALSPQTPNMAVMSSHFNAATTRPIATGGYIMYCQDFANSTSVHQIQPGILSNSPESFNISTQLNNYISGSAIEIIHYPTPTTLFVRSTGDLGALYVFSHMEKANEGRVQDAWHRWKFNDKLGYIMGLTVTDKGLVIFYTRVGDDGVLLVVADSISLTTDVSNKPYLDSSRSHFTNQHLSQSNPDLFCAFDGSTPYKFIGAAYSELDAIYNEFISANGLSAEVIVGYSYDSVFTPTNPYIKTDKGVANLNGILTVSSMTVNTISAGFFYTLKDISNNSITSDELTSRIVGAQNDYVGQEPVGYFSHTISICDDNTNYELTLKARNWLPLCIQSIDYTGQHFNNTRRI